MGTSVCSCVARGIWRCFGLSRGLSPLSPPISYFTSEHRYEVDILAGLCLKKYKSLEGLQAHKAKKPIKGQVAKYPYGPVVKKHFPRGEDDCPYGHIGDDRDSDSDEEDVCEWVAG